MKHFYWVLGILIVGIGVSIAVWPRLSPIPAMHESEPSASKLPAKYISAPEGYSWVDRSSGVARIPIDRAMKIVAEKGLPFGPVPEEPEPVKEPGNAQAAGAGAPSLDASMVQIGMALFTTHRCSGCHVAGTTFPQLNGRYGTKVALEGGEQVSFDDAYIRESMLDPKAKIPAGFKDRIMPAYKDRVTDDEMKQIILYIRSLK